MTGGRVVTKWSANSCEVNWEMIKKKRIVFTAQDDPYEMWTPVVWSSEHENWYFAVVVFDLLL